MDVCMCGLWCRRSIHGCMCVCVNSEAGGQYMDVRVWTLRPEVNTWMYVCGLWARRSTVGVVPQNHLPCVWVKISHWPGAYWLGCLAGQQAPGTVPNFLWLQGLELRSLCLQDRHFTFWAVLERLTSCIVSALCWFLKVWRHFYCLCFPVTSLLALTASDSNVQRGNCSLLALVNCEVPTEQLFIGDAWWVTWDFLNAWEEADLTPGVAVERQWAKGFVSSHILEAAIGRNRGF